MSRCIIASSPTRNLTASSFWHRLNVISSIDISSPELTVSIEVWHLNRHDLTPPIDQTTTVWLIVASQSSFFTSLPYQSSTHQQLPPSPHESKLSSLSILLNGFTISLQLVWWDRSIGAGRAAPLPLIVDSGRSLSLWCGIREERGQRRWGTCDGWWLDGEPERVDPIGTDGEGNAGGRAGRKGGSAIKGTPCHHRMKRAPKEVPGGENRQRWWAGNRQHGYEQDGRRRSKWWARWKFFPRLSTNFKFSNGFWLTLYTGDSIRFISGIELPI